MNQNKSDIHFSNFWGYHVITALLIVFFSLDSSLKPKKKLLDHCFKLILYSGSGMPDMQSDWMNPFNFILLYLFLLHLFLCMPLCPLNFHAFTITLPSLFAAPQYKMKQTIFSRCLRPNLFIFSDKQ